MIRFNLNLILFIFLISSKITQCQEFDWWNEKHDWDGTTHWSDYLIMSPKFFGPNAFPIPFPEKIIEETNLDLSFNYHSNKNEFSKDILSKISIPFGSKVNIKLQINPVEYFSMDSVIRDKRFIRDKKSRGYSVGDLLFETKMRLYGRKNCELNMNVGLKTASGSQLMNARYTDSPSYYFNIVWFNEFSLNQKFNIETGFLLGLYVWQTNLNDYRQNDALLSSLLINFSFKNFNIQNSIRGFKGYIGNGDFPILYRIKFSTNVKNKEFFVFKQYTLKDNPFNTLSFGISSNF